MRELRVTLIDVGWGDSIFVEYIDNNGIPHYGLIDSNDSKYYRSSYIFLKKFFERKNVRLPDDKPVFEFVMLSHGHTDHGQGLKSIMREYGTQNFWYPKSTQWSSMTELIRYTNLSSNVDHHQSIDESKTNVRIGNLPIRILWPLYDQIDQHENNNSVVAEMTLGTVSIILSGDAEGQVWNQISGNLPHTQAKMFFKVPHHGSINGTIYQGGYPWFSAVSGIQDLELGISSHVRPHTHPDQPVIDLFDHNSKKYYRTDEHYHITFFTDGNNADVKYSHV